MDGIRRARLYLLGALLVMFVGSADAEPPSLLVLLRGEAFRRCGRGDRRTDGDLGGQEACLASVDEFLLKPLASAGWRPTVLVDAVFARDNQTEALFRTWCARIGASGVRVSARVASPVQRYSWLDTLRWAALERRLGAFSALLITRLDLNYRVAPPLPTPERVARDGRFHVPWRLNGASKDTPLVADTLVFLPAARLGEFEAFLTSPAADHKAFNFSLHMLAHPVCGVPSEVAFLYNRAFSATTDEGWNPMYDMLDRITMPDLDTALTWSQTNRHDGHTPDYKRYEAYKSATSLAQMLRLGGRLADLHRDVESAAVELQQPDAAGAGSVGPPGAGSVGSSRAAPAGGSAAQGHSQWCKHSRRGRRVGHNHGHRTDIEPT